MANHDEASSPSRDRVVTHAIELDHDPDVVWKLFTDAERLASWLGTGSSIELRPGGVVTTPDPVSGRPKVGSVDRVDPGKSLELTWWPAGDDGAGPTESSLVCFELEEIDAGTRLTVTETALPVADRVDVGTPRARAGTGGAIGVSWAWRLAMFSLVITLQPVR